ncbi:MAG: radical SAM protein [Lagierella massiliensis]|nr:radical SAM protein [Lagierella massiliensis]
MKQSFYNTIVKLPNTEFYAIYNTKSGCLALLNEKEYCNLNKPLNFKDWDSNTWEELKNAGFIVGKEFNELEEIEYNMNKSRFSNSHLSLTIAPTADCNFRCSYCYEKNNIKMAYMKDETICNLLKFIESEMKNKKYLNICWYGGEPLLAVDIIEKISKKIFKIQEELGFNYEGSMVTNGYLLNRNMVLKLNKLHIDNYQITLDGNKKYHDKRRFLKCGKGTYRQIIKNLTDINDICPNISIRINVDKDNINYISNLIGELKSLDVHNKLFLYIGKVENYQNIYDEGVCFNDREFYMEQVKFSKSYFEDSLRDIYPSVKSNFCCADNESSLIIGYDGSVYKCWSDIGEEKKIVGEIKDEGLRIYKTKYYYDLLTFNPTKELYCSSCKYLPICMGGCPYERINAEKQCMKEKMNLESYIKELSLEIIGGNYENFNSK